MQELRCVPWKDGYYKLQNLNNTVLQVNGENAKMVNLVGQADDTSFVINGSWKYGHFEEAKHEIREYTNKTNYNVDVELWNGMWKTKGVVNDDGTKVTIWGASNELDHFELISDEEFIALKESGDPASAPSHHYKLQPDFQGKLLFISGAPGLGKSTTGHILSKTAGYVYYEADAFGQHLNPYIPPDANEPTLACMKQKRLKDIPRERLAAVEGGMQDFLKMLQGEQYNIENIKGFFTAMCKDIKTERKRIGGDWVIATAILNRTLRDHIKEQLGPDLIFVVLNMSKEDQMKRISSRHGEEGGVAELCIKMFEMFEPVQSDESNAIGVDVTCNMSREEVVEKVLNTLPS